MLRFPVLTLILADKACMVAKSENEGASVPGMWQVGNRQEVSIRGLIVSEYVTSSQGSTIIGPGSSLEQELIRNTANIKAKALIQGETFSFDYVLDR